MRAIISFFTSIPVLCLLIYSPDWEVFKARSQNRVNRLLASSRLSVCLSVCPSNRPRGTTRLPLDGFS
jgi:hypothetical protein